MSSITVSASTTSPPYEVDECRGVLRVCSNGSIWRSSKPSFNVPVDDNGSVVWEDVIFALCTTFTSGSISHLPSSPSSITSMEVAFAFDLVPGLTVKTTSSCLLQSLKQ